MPSIHDHKHGKLMKLQSVRGSNMGMREKILACVRILMAAFFKTGEHFLPPSLLENIPLYNMPSGCSWKKAKGKKKMTQIIEIFLRACKSVSISLVSLQQFSALKEVAKLKF